jgi:hypothetical protein
MSDEKIVEILEEINGTLVMINENVVAAQASQEANASPSNESLEELINRVRPGIKPNIIIRGILAKVQKDMEDELEAKTGWGRVELKRMLAQVLSNVDKWGIESFK